MSSIERLSDQELWEKTESLAKEERKLTTLVIEHLREIEKRRLFLERGFSSLFEYCVKYLKYSESSAQRRIDAMRAIKTMPELKQKIESGKITLSAVATAQSFFRQEAKQNRPVSEEKKLELFKSLEGKTKKEAEKTLCSEFPLALPRDKERELTKEKTEIRFVASKELMEKLKRIKSLVSHKNPNPSYEELFNLMAEFVLKAKDPLRRPPPQRQCKVVKFTSDPIVLSANPKPVYQLRREVKGAKAEDLPAERSNSGQASKDFSIKTRLKQDSGEAMPTETATRAVTEAKATATRASTARRMEAMSRSRRTKPTFGRLDSTARRIEAMSRSTATSTTTTAIAKESRYIPSVLRQEIWYRDGGVCSYKDPVTGRKCESRHQLQIDHIYPLALGGKTELSNLRLVCRRHNLHLAMKTFGERKVQSFIR